MRRGRILIVVALILILCVVAAYFVTRGLGQGTGTADETQTAPDVAFIVIAAQDIPRGAEIVPDAVVSAPFPADSVVETMLTTGQATGFTRLTSPRPAVTKTCSPRAGDASGGFRAAIAIPRGMTAIAVPMTRLSSVAYALRPGDKVDVLATFMLIDLDRDFQTREPNDTLIMLDRDLNFLTAFVCNEFNQSPDGQECLNPIPPPYGKLVNEPVSQEPLYGKPQSLSALVCQPTPDRLRHRHPRQDLTLEAEEEAAVAAGGAGRWRPAGAGGAGRTAGVGPVIVRPDIVTLIVTPQDALALNWAMKSGVDLVLTLRAPGDTSADVTTSVTLQYLFETYNITVPAKQPYGLEPRLDKVIVPVLPNDGAPAPGQ
jgi:pilus assembly protein CpaB